MKEKIFETKSGNIHYWVNEWDNNRLTLIFLPGLTADHRLFEKQIEYFDNKYNVLVWDAPGHNMSRPFSLNFTLSDKAAWLHSIMETEKVNAPVIIGQSMGGYVGQSYLDNYPGTLKGFVSIDSAPLKKKYMKASEIWLLKHTEIIYKPYPWKSLQKAGANGCAETEYGRNNMREMMETYEKPEYCRLICIGYRMLAQAIELDHPYNVDCPALLLCGENDKAGYTKRYNEVWSQSEQLPIVWIPNAGHNSNADNPKLVNEQIEQFLLQIH